MASIETLLKKSTDDLEKLLANETELLAIFAEAFNLEHKLISEGLTKQTSDDTDDDADSDTTTDDAGNITPRIRKAKSLSSTKSRDEKAREKIERQKAELLELAKLLNNNTKP